MTNFNAVHPEILPEQCDTSTLYSLLPICIGNAFELAFCKRKLLSYGVKLTFVDAHNAIDPSGVLLDSQMEGIFAYSEEAQGVQLFNRCPAVRGDAQ